MEGEEEEFGLEEMAEEVERFERSMNATRGELRRASRDFERLGAPAVAA